MNTLSDLTQYDLCVAVLLCKFMGSISVITPAAIRQQKTRLPCMLFTIVRSATSDMTDVVSPCRTCPGNTPPQRSSHQDHCVTINHFRVRTWKHHAHPAKEQQDPWSNRFVTGAKIKYLFWLFSCWLISGQKRKPKARHWPTWSACRIYCKMQCGLPVARALPITQTCSKSYILVAGTI